MNETYLSLLKRIQIMEFKISFQNYKIILA